MKSNNGILNGIVKVTNKKVSARELHEKLGVGRDFTTWIKGRIEKYGFGENVDYEIINLAHQSGGTRWGGNNKVDYILTLNMAKELAMVENNEIGREIRKYFIDCEKYILETKQYNSFLEWRIQEAHNTHELHQSIDDSGKCIGLCKTLKNIVAYKFNFENIYSKELLFQAFLGEDNKEAWLYYLEIKDKAEKYIETFRDIDDEHYMSNVIDTLLKTQIDDIDNYKQYIQTHEYIDMIKGFGRPKLK